MIADDPKKLEQLQNHFYDDEFDDWLEEFDREQEEKQKQKSSQDEDLGDSSELDKPDKETIEWANKNRSLPQEDNSEDNSEDDSTVYDDDYEISVPTEEISDWEEVN